MYIKHHRLSYAVFVRFGRMDKLWKGRSSEWTRPSRALEPRHGHRHALGLHGPHAVATAEIGNGGGGAETTDRVSFFFFFLLPYHALVLFALSTIKRRRRVNRVIHMCVCVRARVMYVRSGILR